MSAAIVTRESSHFLANWLDVGGCRARYTGQELVRRSRIIGECGGRVDTSAPQWMAPVLEGALFATPQVFGSSIYVATEHDAIERRNCSKRSSSVAHSWALRRRPVIYRVAISVRWWALPTPPLSMRLDVNSLPSPVNSWARHALHPLDGPDTATGARDASPCRSRGCGAAQLSPTRRSGARREASHLW